MALPGGVQFGGWEFPPPDVGGGIALVTWDSGAKVDEKESDGKNDARTTFKGSSPAKFEVELRWSGRATSTDDYAVRMLKDLSPRGPNAGKPWEFVAADQEIHNAFNAMVKTIRGPVRTAGQDEVTAKISCSSWVKPKATKSVAKTPKKAEPWAPQKEDPPKFNLVQDPPGGFADANTKPTVTP